MKITVLDMDTAAIHEDIMPTGLGALGELHIVGGTDLAHTAEKIGDSDAVICNKSRIDRAVMEQCPHLHYVGLMGTGFDQVDLAAANEHGVTVCNVPSYSTNAVAQHTFALILNEFCQIAAYSSDCANGGWTEKKYYNVFGLTTHELAGKTLGLIGCGNIGKKVAAIANAFDMNVLAYSRTPEKLRGISYLQCVGLEALLAASDVVSLHCPLNDDTRELINRRTLAMMKRSALLVNTARGGIINEFDLAQALDEGVIAAAAVDALTVEPMSEDTPLRHAQHFTVTPHVAWAPVETRARLFHLVCQNLKCYVEGNPQNVVNQPQAK